MHTFRATLCHTRSAMGLQCDTSSSYTLFGYVAIAPATIAFHAFLFIACVRVFVSMSLEICATHVGFGLPTGRLEPHNNYTFTIR